MKYTVYKIVHIKTLRYYIGVHKVGMGENLYSYMGSGKKIKLVVAKYPKEEFLKSILHEVDEEELAYFIEGMLVTEDTLKDPLCMNLTPGGNIPPKLTKEQLSKRNKNVAKSRKANNSYSDLSHWKTTEVIEKRVKSRKSNKGYSNPLWLQDKDVQLKSKSTRKDNNNFNWSQLNTPEANENRANKLRKLVYQYDLEGNFISSHLGIYKISRELNIIPGKIQRNNDPLRIWLRERNDIEALEISNKRKFND